MVSEQGVRQLGPIELFASAPAGSDSTWTVEAGGGAEGNFKSQLGIQLEMPHPARESPKATPATPLARPMTTSAASAVFAPAADHTGASPPTQRLRCRRRALSRPERGDRARQLAEMADHPVGLEQRRRHVGIAEVDRDHRHTRRPSDRHVGGGIPDHHGAGEVAARARDGLAQQFRVGLCDPERVLAADRGKAAGKPEPLQQKHGEVLELVGAYRKAGAPRGQQIERRLNAGEGLRMVGDMCGVMRDENGEQAIEIGRVERGPLPAERARQHVAGAAADHDPRLRIGHGGVAFAREHRVERGNEVGRGVDQGSVEIEHNGWLWHRGRLGRAGVGKLVAGFSAKGDAAAAKPVERARAPLGARAQRGYGWTPRPRPRSTMDADHYKRQAAARALDFVSAGMRVGLGTGSTPGHFIQLLAERVRAGLDVVGVPTSQATRAHAERLGIPLTTLDDAPELDLTVDGADEIAPDLSLIKGGGGALLCEKIVAAASTRMVVIADHSKWVALLGHFPLPVEVVPFGLAATRRAVEAAAAAADAPGPAPLR